MQEFQRRRLAVVVVFLGDQSRYVREQVQLPPLGTGGCARHHRALMVDEHPVHGPSHFRCFRMVVQPCVGPFQVELVLGGELQKSRILDPVPLRTHAHLFDERVGRVHGQLGHVRAGRGVHKLLCEHYAVVCEEVVDRPGFLLGVLICLLQLLSVDLVRPEDLGREVIQGVRGLVRHTARCGSVHEASMGHVLDDPETEIDRRFASWQPHGDERVPGSRCPDEFHDVVGPRIGHQDDLRVLRVLRVLRALRLLGFLRGGLGDVRPDGPHQLAEVLRQVRALVRCLREKRCRGVVVRVRDGRGMRLEFLTRLRDVADQDLTRAPAAIGLHLDHEGTLRGFVEPGMVTVQEFVQLGVVVGQLFDHEGFVFRHIPDGGGKVFVRFRDVTDHGHRPFVEIPVVEIQLVETALDVLHQLLKGVSVPARSRCRERLGRLEEICLVGIGSTGQTRGPPGPVPLGQVQGERAGRVRAVREQAVGQQGDEGTEQFTAFGRGGVVTVEEPEVIGGHLVARPLLGPRQVVRRNGLQERLGRVQRRPVLDVQRRLVRGTGMRGRPRDGALRLGDGDAGGPRPLHGGVDVPRCPPQQLLGDDRHVLVRRGQGAEVVDVLTEARDQKVRVLGRPSQSHVGLRHRGAQRCGEFVVGGCLPPQPVERSQRVSVLDRSPCGVLSEAAGRVSRPGLAGRAGVGAGGAGRAGVGAVGAGRVGAGWDVAPYGLGTVSRPHRLGDVPSGSLCRHRDLVRYRLDSGAVGVGAEEHPLDVFTSVLRGVWLRVVRAVRRMVSGLLDSARGDGGHAGGPGRARP